MKKVAKLILVNKDGKYLMLYRSGHPLYPDDADLPGGTLEDGEEIILALMREVLEETGIPIDVDVIEKLGESKTHQEGFIYYLFQAKCESKPEISLSWEHSSYEWLAPQEFKVKAKTAVDTYMHMVYDYLEQERTS